MEVAQTAMREVNLHLDVGQTYTCIDVYLDHPMGTFAAVKVSCGTEAFRGRALPHAVVTLEIGRHVFKTKADANGNYSLRPAGLPRGEVRLRSGSVTRAVNFQGQRQMVDLRQ